MTPILATPPSPLTSFAPLSWLTHALTVSCALGVIAGCADVEAPSDGRLDPVLAVQGTFVRGGASLTISGVELSTGYQTLRLGSDGLRRASPGSVSFDDAVIHEGVMFNDHCSGTVSVATEGVDITLSGHDDCSVFQGVWVHNGAATIRAARNEVASLRFLEAANRLRAGTFNASDSAGRAAANSILASQELEAGLLWQSADAEGETRPQRMVALIQMGGVSEQAGRAWLANEYYLRAAGACAGRKLRARACRDAALKLGAWPQPEQSAAQQNADALVERVGAAWLQDAAQRVASGDVDGASSDFAAICDLSEGGALCAQATARDSAAQLQRARRAISMRHYEEAGRRLQQLAAGRDRPTADTASALLNSSAFRCGRQLQLAATLLTSVGPTTAALSAFETVCAADANSSLCRQARGEIGSIRLKLGLAAVQDGRFSDAERILSPLADSAAPHVRSGADKLRDAESFAEGLRVEHVRARGASIVAECNQRAPSCESAATAFLAEANLPQDAATGTRASLVGYRQAVAASATAHARTEELFTECSERARDMQLRRDCFAGPLARFVGRPYIAPGMLERAGQEAAVTLFGEAPPTSGTGWWGCAAVGALLGGMLGYAARASAQGRYQRAIVVVTLVLLGFASLARLRNSRESVSAAYGELTAPASAPPPAL